MRRVIALGAIGTTAEYFDFGLAVATAALIWPAVFFPSSDPVAAVALSFGTYGVSFLFQPVGALLFGHIGDRYGRKVPLMVTLLAMGLGSLGLALTPSYASVGIVAPVVVVILRAVQGMGFGGEWAGAVTWMSESAADSKKRGFWTSWVAVARTVGAVSATAAFSYLAASMPRTAFIATGWRWLFVVGAVIVVVGILLRRAYLTEAVFQEAKEQRRLLRRPSLEVIRKFGTRIVGLALAYSIIVTVIVLFQATYSLSYLISLPGSPFTRYEVTMLLVVGRVWEVPAALISGSLADRVGRKKMLIIGTVATLLAVIALIPLLSTEVVMLVVLSFALTGVAVNIVSASVPSLLAESFPTEYRYSGVGLAFNIPSLVSGVITTFVVPFLLATRGGTVAAAPYVVGVVVALGIVSLLFSLRVRETLGSDLRTS